MGAAALLATATALANDPPPAWEVSLFRAVNDLPRQAEWLLWPVQQAGMILAVPVGAAILWAMVRHRRPPVALLLYGVFLGWGGTKVIKLIVERARPGAILTEVQLGFDSPASGVGFPSGHAAVAVMLAVVLSPYVSLRLRWLLYTIAGLVCFARVYLGAHLPLDVIAGAAYGVIVGSLLLLTTGIPAARLPQAQLGPDTQSHRGLGGGREHTRPTSAHL